VPARAAVDVLRPHLTVRQRDLYDRLPTAKLEAAQANLKDRRPT
jgi:hypothetical protein